MRREIIAIGPNIGGIGGGSHDNFNGVVVSRDKVGRNVPQEGTRVLNGVGNDTNVSDVVARSFTQDETN